MIETWGDGRAVLCLHCSLARGRAWAGVAKHLRGWRVIAPDLPGHGAGADADTARDFHDQATEAVTCSLPEEPAPIIGHSFGATVALRLAIERPGQVSALVLYEPVLFAAAGDGPGRRQTAARDNIGDLLSKGQKAAALERFLSVWGAPGGAMKPELRAYMEARVPLIEAASPALNQDTARLLPRLGKLSIPVLLLEGSESPPVVPEINAALATALADARRDRVAGAGHMGPVTHARAVADRARSFLENGARG